MCEVLVTGTLPLFRRMLLTSNTCRYSTMVRLERVRERECGREGGRRVGSGERGLGLERNSSGNGEFTSDFYMDSLCRPR